MPFDDDDGKKPPIKKKGVKIDNQNSSIPQPKPDTAALFDNNAILANSKYEEYKQRTWELSLKFKSMIEDRTLPENKSILVKGIESETLTKLVSLASDMNEDDNQPEAIGSVALSMLLMKMLLLQRDTINILMFNIDKLERSNSKLEKMIKSNEGQDIK